jgi:hypothetical protein
VRFTSARTCFEETAHFHYYLTRFEGIHASIVSIWNQIEARALKHKAPTEEMNKRFFELHLELIKKLKKAREGSNYDWSSWFRKKAESRKLDMAFTVKEHEVVRKTHINACIEELNKKQQLDATEIYGLLCEMVHPNFGSNTLVIATREKLSDVAGNVVLSSHPKNLEAAAWFF